MKAWRVEAHGGLEALKNIEVATPEPGPMEVRVKVEAVGLNHLDLWVRKGVTGYKFPLPLTLGCDVTGVIEKFGAGSEKILSAARFKIGSGVIVSPGVSCGRCEACLGGFDPLCKNFGIIGETRDGGCAEFIVVPVANLILRPANLSTIEAAALATPFLTAYTMLFKKAALKPGEFVLIQAGGSGVSVAAIQMAKMIGATVITTVGTPEKAAKARALGANHALVYKNLKIKDEIKKILSASGRKGCEVVLDHVGQDTFSDSLSLLAWGGRLVTCGATSGAEIKLDLKAVFFKNISILGSTMGSKADLIRIVDLVAQGKLKAVIDSTLPMSKLPDAHARLESRAAFGKIVVTL